MNKLTKVLLEDLLDTKKTVAIYGGGFKPPTKGHFNVAEKVLADFPEIDELKIFVGSGVRDGITQDESLAIWNIYKNYLSDKVDIEPSIAPVKSVLGYAKENPDTKVYWILGAREDDEEDLKDIASRTRSIEKYPNLEVKVISTKGGVSGTKTRKAIADNNKEQFFHLIPDVKEKEEIWNIVSNIQESVTPDELKQADAFADKQLAPIDVDLTSKHVLDRLTSRESDVTLAQLIGFFKRLGKHKKEFMDFFSKFKEIVATDDRTNLNIPFINLANKAIAKTIMRKDDFETTNPKLVFEVGEANLKPYKWEEVDVEGYWVYTRFVTDSETQYDVDIKSTVYFPPGQMDSRPALEIEFSAKPKGAEGSSSKIVVNKGEMYKVMSTIADIVKKYTKKARAEAIIYSPSKKSSEENFGTQRDNLYRAFISKAFPGTTFKQSGDDITAILPNNAALTLNEGRYDSLTRDVVRDIMDDWKSQFDGSNGKLEYNEDYESGIIDFELYAVLTVKETKYGLYKVDGGADPLRKPAYLEIKFQVDPRDLPQKWEDIYMDLTDVVRHELEHMTQQGTNVIASKEMADDEIFRKLIKLKFLPKSDYYKLEQEVDAMLQGMYLKAKKSKTPFIEVINDYFDKARVNKKDRQDILDLWRQRAKALSLPLNEGKQVGPLYHYTSADGLKGILNSNRINASEEHYLGNDLYYISFTRNKNFHNKGSKFGVKTEYRITLDGDKLSNKYKITPFAYKPGWNYEDNWEYDWLEDEPESVVRDFFNNTGDYDEQEERISFKGPDGGIDNIKNYILSVDKVEDLQEGRPKKKDPKKGTGKKPEGSGRRLYTDENPKDTVGISFKTKEDIVDTLNKASFKSKSHARQSQIINLIHQRVRAAYGKAKDPEVKARLKRGLDYIESRKEASKKKTERLRKMKEASDPQAGTALPYGSGFAPIKESYQFKISNKNYDSEDNSLITVEYRFSTPNNNYRVEFNSFEYSPESKTFDVSFGLDKGDNFKLDTFQMTGKNNALNILKTIVNIIIDFTNKFEVNKLVINPTSEKRGKVYSMILKSLPTNILNKIEIINEKPSDPFGLNELARNFVEEVFEESWNPEEAFLSLSVFMKDNGMNITPLPKIKVISDDKENASRLLGKTAYYNPADKSITLYTFGRHPKDVLRSFAHEMVHHEQNLNDTLGNISTTNTNEDGHLEKLEKEAYLKGNIMLRNWEDSIKNV